MRNSHLTQFASALFVLTVLTSATRADELSDLRQALQALEQKILVLERKQELKDEAAAAAPKPAVVTAADGRIEIASANGQNSLRLRGLVQADYRWYDAANDPADTFLVRRARLIVEGRFSQIFSYVLQPELSGTVQILDANVNAAISPAFNVRLGKFKVPVGLEQLQSDPVAFFNERSVASGLTPVRDVGLQVQGDLLGQTVNYTVALLNGVPDGASSSGTDFDTDKTIAARLFATPFANEKDSFLNGLGVGVAVSAGDYATTAGRAAGYRTDGQQNFFTYDASVVAAGSGLTVTPQGYFYRGPFGLLAEYVISSIDVQRAALGVREVKNHAYNLSAGWVLTGEANSYRGVTPRTVFSPSAGTWGAFEIVGRIAGVDIDDTVFSGPAAARLANPNTSATQLTTYAVGLNWFLSRSVRAGFNLYHNEFDLAPGAAPATTALIADDETTFISRLQVSF
ncbi:Porin O precursor [Lacunisphaera limnophila]|uniref:Porin O n=1 Tax=Lacunisphaera limnophila TaxID=1838286 RepID=A0A1I7PHH8_9BACT|nr:porin [Lacunisphaera limnophila]AOS43060.1 Porin O precursor [Lacunisphaera limnophila]